MYKKGSFTFSYRFALRPRSHGFNIGEYNYVVQSVQYCTRGPKEFNIIEFTSKNKTKVESTGWPKAFNMLN